MDWLKAIYPDVRNTLLDSVPEYWPAMHLVLDSVVSGPFLNGAILPLAACAAVGGTARAAIPVSASLIASALSARIFDDVQDKDRPSQLWTMIGESRAWNYGMAMYGLAFRILNQSDLPDEICRQINQLFLDAFFYMAAGQERDLVGATHSVEDYWKTIELKTGTAYAVACAAGAMVGTHEVAHIQSCYTFGHHVGIIIQIFNDYDSIWKPDGISDIVLGKVTLPVIYALRSDHPDRNLLAEWVQSSQMSNHADHVMRILDEIDAKTFMVWAALKEREQALNALTNCPDNEGRNALIAFITGMFGDVDGLVD